MTEHSTLTINTTIFRNTHVLPVCLVCVLVIVIVIIFVSVLHKQLDTATPLLLEKVEDGRQLTLAPYSHVVKDNQCCN